MLGRCRHGAYAVRAYGSPRTARADGSDAASALAAHRLPAGAAASYYGPGLYGDGLACGGTLQPGTLGVANKTLPCGTMVTLRYHGRTVTVPVVDRGPYVAGRDFDLTDGDHGRGSTSPASGVLLSSR